MPSLRDLDASFLKLLPTGSHQLVEDLKGSDGIMFDCPACGVGGHVVICWWGHVPREVRPGPGRWNPQGTGLHDLTFVGPGAVSVKLLGGCGWHGHVVNGQAG